MHEINGLIRAYLLKVTEIDTGNTFMVKANTTHTTVNGLHPFYKYNCTVAAETIAPGPYSTEIVVQLDEEGVALTSLGIRCNVYAMDGTEV